MKEVRWEGILGSWTMSYLSKYTKLEYVQLKYISQDKIKNIISKLRKSEDNIERKAFVSHGTLTCKVFHTLDFVIN